MESKKRQARENLEFNKVESMMNKPETNIEKSKTKEDEGATPISPISPAAPVSSSPASTSQSQRQNPHEKRNYANAVVWPVITICRTSGALWSRSWNSLWNFLHKNSGGLQVVATIAIVVLTFVYVKYSKRLWQVAQDTLIVSQRAYVTIGKKDGVVASFIPSQNPQQNAQLVVYFQNSGHVPAKIAWGTSGLAFIAGAPGTSQLSGIKYYGPPFMGLPMRTRDKKTGAISEHAAQPGQQSAIIAGDSIFVAPIGEISMQNLTDLPTKNVSTMVMGGYEYCDELGTDVRHQFMLSYQNAPNADLTFKLVHDGSFPNPPHIPTADVEYLPPCETLAQKPRDNK
jgi:hypothetical protein